MSTLQERLMQALAAKPGSSKAALSRACGVSKASVTDWFNGQTKSLDGQNLLAAATYFGVRPEWLGSGRGAMTAREKGQQAAAYQLEDMAAWDDSTPMDSDDVELPLFKEVEFAAGAGRTHHIEINGRKLRFSLATLRAAGVDPANAACATNRGRSMERLILDGATIGIDRGRTQVKDGKIYAIDHGGELRVKYLYRLPGGGLRVRSENADEYPDENYGPDWHQAIKVLGWVFWWSRLETW